MVDLKLPISKVDNMMIHLPLTMWVFSYDIWNKATSQKFKMVGYSVIDTLTLPSGVNVQCNNLMHLTLSLGL